MVMQNLKKIEDTRTVTTLMQISVFIFSGLFIVEGNKLFLSSVFGKHYFET